jgi:hypothetical protein
MRNNWPTIMPAVWVSGRSVVKVMAATIGKKISAPSQKKSAEKSLQDQPLAASFQSLAFALHQFYFCGHEVHVFCS